MRWLLLFVAILVVTSVCFSEDDINSSIAAVLRQELNWTTGYNVSYFGLDGENYGFISYNGTERFVVKIIGNNTTLITKNETLDYILRARNRMLLKDTIVEILGHIIVFNESRSLEAKCKVSLGLDKSPCWDVDTCLYRSCIYSQATCIPFAQGNGKPFLEAMAGFSKASVAIDMDVGEFTKALNAFASGGQGQTLKETPLTDIEAQVESIRNNNLFKAYVPGGTGYDFCNPIPYRMDAIESAKLKVRQVNLGLSSDEALNATRDYILSQTLKHIDEVERAKKADIARLEELKTSASAEFDSVYLLSKNASETITSKSIDARIVYLNQSLQQLKNISNYSMAADEHKLFMNESRIIKETINKFIEEFDSVAKLSNACSSVLIKAEANVTSSGGKAKLEELKKRKEGLDALMGPPVDEKYLGSIKADLNSIITQAESLILEEQTLRENEGPNSALILAVVILVLAAVGAYWLKKNEKLKFSFLKSIQKKKSSESPAPTEKTEESGKPIVPEPAKGKQAVFEKTQTQVARTIPMVQYKVKLVAHGGTYRTKIKSLVKDKDGHPVPDGTIVTFKTDSGVITPSAVTKGGVVYASMAFNNKPESVTVVVTALGIERAVKINFV